MNGPVPVITPTHKEFLSPTEIRRLKLTLKSNPNSAHFFVTPTGMSFQKLLSDFPNSSILSKPSEFFTSVNSYNSLMLSRDFYSDYQSYEYILIAQTALLTLFRLMIIFILSWVKHAWYTINVLHLRVIYLLLITVKHLNYHYNEY